MLRCAICGYTEHYVEDSRNNATTTEYLHRRRKCTKCGHKFKTVELSHEQYNIYVRAFKEINLHKNEEFIINDIKNLINIYENGLK